MNNYSQLGGGTNVYTASYQPMWDISNTTTWVKGNHTFNAGFNFRSVDAQSRPRQRVPRRVQLQRRLHGQSRGRHAARVLLGCLRVPARAIRRRRAIGQPARVPLQVLRAVRAGRLEGLVPADGERRPALGLPDDAVRDERPHGLAGHVRTRSAACASPTRTSSRRGSSATAVSTAIAAGSNPKDPSLGRLRSAARVCLAPDLQMVGRSCAAATACSTTRPKGVRSTARRTSIRT